MFEVEQKCRAKSIRSAPNRLKVQLFGASGGGKQEVGLVVQGEDDRGEGADDVTEEHCHRSTSS